MSADRRPNIVLVVLDTLTADAAGLTRTPTRMPTLNSMAERGLLFTHGVSNAPWTYPSHASLFSGLLPCEHRMEVPVVHAIPAGPRQRDEAMRLVRRAAPGNNPTLADRWLPAALGRAGYETVCVSNNPWVGRWAHMDHGFERVEDVPFATLFRPPRALRRFPRLRSSVRAADYAYRILRGRQDLRARAALERVASWSGGRDRSRPYFLFVNLMEAHLPYFTPRSPQAVQEVGAGPATTYRAMRLTGPRESALYNMGLLHDRRIPRALEALRSLHRHAATYLDGRIRELHELSVRDGRGLVMCVTSDHGDAFGEHGAVFHGITLDEPILHVPLVVAGDGVPTGERRGTVEIRQVYATVLSAAGVDTPPGSVPSLLEDGAGTRAIVAERDRTDAPAGLSATPRARERLGRIRAVYRDPWKLVSTPVGTRLFDLSRDPAETTDLAAAEPVIVGELEGTLPPWPEGPAESQGPTEERPSPLSGQEQDEIARQLAALGYLE